LKIQIEDLKSEMTKKELYLCSKQVESEAKADVLRQEVEKLERNWKEKEHSLEKENKELTSEKMLLAQDIALLKQKHDTETLLQSQDFKNKLERLHNKNKVVSSRLQSQEINHRNEKRCLKE
jgi:hypothetical protein